ncbi:alpha/beta hydrolase [Shewanella sp. A32]|uniref:alpha/beta fold hydrolase n=1 Tax=Shewanella sp. A32 TaxID=3031327 RepID=UPI0023B8E76C|nr:alpha/beta hydrolase [Shewanella sp. A32]MDF0533076.1 alpha/beta hydrolase [Shewanella sp. A32]
MYSNRQSWLLITMAAGILLNGVANAAAKPAYGPELEGFSYPWPVKQFQFESQQQPLHMAYMDLQPTKANGHTVVLLHGKNFCAATWEDTGRSLSAAGYRVVIPDQIGFCKSSKPRTYQYSFQQLAQNTHELLASLSINKAIIMGHSTGGMLAARYSLMYPADTEQLVMVNPIGLEDWKAKGVPFIGVDGWYRQALQTTDEGIRNYERKTYYAGEWQPAYEKWVQMLAGMYRGPGKEIVAWNSALLYDMIYSQPVVYELPDISVPSLLMIGERDTTAPGKNLASAEDRAKLGNYPLLAREAAKRIANAQLVLFPNYGHAPQMQAPAEFHKSLLAHLIAP